MGWGSATRIMDVTLAAAFEAVRAGLVQSGMSPALAECINVNDTLRPFVTTLASLLHDGGWDTAQESDFFEVFPQEMLGLDDREYETWLIEQVRDFDGASKQVAMLMAFRGRQKGKTE